MQVMVELQDGTVRPIEELEVIWYNPLVVVLHNGEDRKAMIAKVHRFFTQKDKQ